MINRFQGPEGQRLLTEALMNQRVIRGNKEFAQEIADRLGKLQHIRKNLFYQRLCDVVEEVFDVDLQNTSGPRMAPGTRDVVSEVCSVVEALVRQRSKDKGRPVQQTVTPEYLRIYLALYSAK